MRFGSNWNSKRQFRYYFFPWISTKNRRIFSWFFFYFSLFGLVCCLIKPTDFNDFPISSNWWLDNIIVFSGQSTQQIYQLKKIWWKLLNDGCARFLAKHYDFVHNMHIAHVCAMELLLPCGCAADCVCWAYVCMGAVSQPCTLLIHVQIFIMC